MIVGILSDSHGQTQRTARAIAALRELGAAELVHCGDICGDGVLELLAEHRVRFVWGNMDFFDASVERYCRTLGLTPPQRVPLTFEADGVGVAVFHGHERPFTRLRRALAGPDEAQVRAIVGDARYVLYGHTHQAADERIGGLRLINPGALHRARIYSVATLDVQSDELRFWQVGDTPDTPPQPWQPQSR